MDFNARDIQELLNQTTPEISNPLDLFLQEIDILMSTEKNTVFGNRQFGQSVEHMLWSTSFNAEWIQQKLTEDIENWCLSGKEFTWTIETELMKGTVKDVGVITIHIKSKQGELLAKPTFIFK